ncbi:MAG: SDR family oxidoreductase [Aestuariibacter sp.]
MDIQHKTIWITGASSGIGAGLASALASQGARLVLSARSEDKLRLLKESLRKSDSHYIAPLDLANHDSIRSACDDILGQGIEIDMLINNGGVSQRGLVRDIALSVHRNVMEVNYFGTIALTQMLLPNLLKNHGKVVNIASVAGKVGGQSMSGYAGSKHALIGFMDCLRAEEEQNGLTVLNVCPGFVQTNISRNALTADGSRFGEMAESIANGISVEQCTSAIIKAIKKEQREIIIGTGLSGWAPFIKRFFPNLLMTLAARKNIR